MPLRIAYIGNFGPPNSTENDLMWSLQQLGHSVIALQEELPQTWSNLSNLDRGDVDMILWTRTAGLAAQIPHAIQRGMQLNAKRMGIPTVGYHLDRWWGLSREGDVLTEPWFQCEYVFTADGAHDADWEFAGVNHHWMPPAICARKAKAGSWREEYATDVAFVGSHFGGYHEEWQHRPELISFLGRTFPGRVAFYPRRPGDPRIDGSDRADLFMSAKVVVGDSCLVPLADGTPMHHYCSDRVFETIGQRGLLLHPLVDGIIGYDRHDDLLLADFHLLAWPLYDWDMLGKAIEMALINPDADEIRQTGFDFVRENHTYTQRMASMIATVLPEA